jgi:hypothetical protein
MGSKSLKINFVEESDVTQLKGVGPMIAKNIIQSRELTGNLSVEDLKHIPHLTVSEEFLANIDFEKNPVYNKLEQLKNTVENLSVEDNSTDVVDEYGMFDDKSQSESHIPEKMNELIAKKNEQKSKLHQSESMQIPQPIETNIPSSVHVPMNPTANISLQYQAEGTQPFQTPHIETKFQPTLPVSTNMNMPTQSLPGNYSPMPVPQMPHMTYFPQQTQFPVSSMYGGYMGPSVPGMMPGVNPMYSMYGMPMAMNSPISMPNTMNYPPSMTPFGYPMGPYYGHMPGNIPGSAGTTVSSVSPCQNPGSGNMGFSPQSQNMTDTKPIIVGNQNIVHSTSLDPQGGAKLKTKKTENK